MAMTDPKKVSKAITQPIVDQIIDTILSGNHIDVAIASAGVPAKMWRKWCQMGRIAERRQLDGDELHYEEMLALDLMVRLRKAVADAEKDDMDHINNARPKDWKAAAWKLERRSPSRWGYTQRHEVVKENPRPMVNHVDTAVLIERAKLLTQRIQEMDVPPPKNRKIESGNSTPNKGSGQ